MMGVHHVAVGQRGDQPGRDRMRRMATHPADGAQGAPPQSASFALVGWRSGEGDQLAVDVAGEGTCQLERVAFAAAE